MKQRRLLLTCLLVAVLALSTCLLGACDLFGGNEGGGNTNPPVTNPTLYSITYVSGADDATGTAPEATKHGAGIEISLIDNPFTRDGYTFKGWSDGSKTYSAGTKFAVPAKDVVFTAVWEVLEQAPTASELNENFYDASNWVYMTNNNGESLDGGDIPYSMNDGSIKFHRANQAYELGDLSNATVSFMLKGTNDWSIWFNSSTKDNANNSSYRLAYAYGGIRLSLSSAPEQAAAVVTDNLYKKGEWNRFDVVFSTVDGVCEIKLYINGLRATLAAGDNTTPQIEVKDNVLTHTQPAMFTTGNYVVVKVWEAHNYVQLKPVAKADEEDLPIIACIGASITEGAGASNFYTESYPSQLQNVLAGAYNVVNFGNSGKTVRTDLGDDVAWLKQYQWQGVQAIVPDIAILNIGTNDSKTSNDPLSTKENFYEAYMNLINKLLEVNPDMEIIICTVPYAYSDIWGISNENIANIIAPVQRQIAEEKGHTLIDLYEFTKNKAHLFGDGVHPTTEGYEMIVKIVKKALLEGEDALTEEFIADLSAQYAVKVTNVSASIAVSGNAINLTVSGDTTLKSGAYLKLVITAGNTPHSSVDAVITDGKFTATIDLASLERVNEWFNIRLYTSETVGQLVLMSQTDGYTVGQEFAAGMNKVILKSWSSADSGNQDTLSFVLGDNTYAKVDSAVIKEVNGIQTLIVSGYSNDSAPKLFVGIDPNKADVYNTYTDIVTDADGKFTVSYDLSTLPVGGWYNVRVYLNGGLYTVVSVDHTFDANENAMAVDNVVYCNNTKLTLKSWSDGGVNTLSFAVAAHTGSAKVTATEVKFENGKLVFSGTTQNVETLTAYLYNTTEMIKDYSSVATLADDGSFTVEIALDQLTLAGGNWYYLWVSINGSDLVKVEYTGYDTNEFYGFGYRVYKWEYYEGIAVNYIDYSYSITNATISQMDGKATLTVEGTLKDSSVAADTISLRLDKTKGTTQKLDLTNLATEAGTFKFVYDISELYDSDVTTQYGEEAYFIRLFVNGTKLVDVNSRWAASKLFDSVESGNSKFYFMRNSGTAWNTLGIVRFDNTKNLPTVTYTGAKLENGKMILSGTCENVNSISVSLSASEDPDNIPTANAVISEGKFTAEVSVESLSKPGSWYFIMVSINGADAVNIIVPYDSTNTCTLSDGRVVSFIDWEGGNTAVKY